jgi:hypothetical protein
VSTAFGIDFYVWHSGLVIGVIPCGLEVGRIPDPLPIEQKHISVKRLAPVQTLSSGGKELRYVLKG